jgi:hypothetical protein
VGGGLCLYDDSVAWASNPGWSIHHNQAGEEGGGVFVTSGTAFLAEGVIEDNAAERGGGIAARGGSITLNGTDIRYNEAEYGGGLASSGSALVNVARGTFRQNVASVRGGGIDAIEGPLELGGVVVDDNEAIYGGGIAVSDEAEVDAVGVRVRGNTADLEGGGVWISTPSSTSFVMTGFGGLEGCHGSGAMPGTDEYCSEIRANTAKYGGGLYMDGGWSAFEHTAFWANRTTTGGEGEAIYLTDEDTSFWGRNSLVAMHGYGPVGGDVVHVGDDSTFEGRFMTITDSRYGTPIHFTGGASGLLIRSIVWDSADTVLDSPFSLNAMCTSFNGVTGATHGVNRDFNWDPQFVTTARGKYRLDSTSVNSIDKCNAGPSYDMDSDPRPVNTLYDRGAFEAQ